jgi:hypothetical protein
MEEEERATPSDVRDDMSPDDISALMTMNSDRLVGDWMRRVRAVMIVASGTKGMTAEKRGRVR